MFTDGLLHASWQSHADPDALNIAVESFLVQEVLQCGAAQVRRAHKAKIETKLLLWH